MVIARYVWFRRGLNKFVADVNAALKNNQHRVLNGFDVFPGFLGLRTLCIAVLE